MASSSASRWMAIYLQSTASRSPRAASLLLLRASRFSRYPERTTLPVADRNLAATAQRARLFDEVIRVGILHRVLRFRSAAQIAPLIAHIQRNAVAVRHNPRSLRRLKFERSRTSLPRLPQNQFLPPLKSLASDRKSTRL